MSKPETAILRALLRGRAFGLEIADRIEAATGARPSPALYSNLRAMVESGLLRCEAGETAPARRGRPRIYYSLTAAGANAYAAHAEREAAR
jgi:DNA-binding PadR family transcriptional regulator